MTNQAFEYRIPSKVVSQIRDIVTAAEAAIQELISQATHGGYDVGPKEADFYQQYGQVFSDAEDRLADIF